MVDEVHTKYVEWPLCVTLLLCMIGASKVEHSVSYVAGCWWVLAAVFVSAASTPHLSACIPSRGHPSRIAAVNKKILVRSIRAKRTRFETFGGL